MVLKKLLGKRKASYEDEDEYIEISDIPKDKSSAGKILVRIEKLKDVKDVENILKELRENKILFVSTQELKNKDIHELRRCIEKIKRTVTAMDGDIVMGPHSILIICPNFAMIERKKEE